MMLLSVKGLNTDKNVFAKMLYDDGIIDEIGCGYTRWFDCFTDILPGQNMYTSELTKFVLSVL